MVLSSEFKSPLFPVRVSFSYLSASSLVYTVSCDTPAGIIACSDKQRFPKKSWHIALLVQKCLQALIEFAAYPKPYMPPYWIHGGLLEALVLLGLGAVSEGLV